MSVHYAIVIKVSSSSSESAVVEVASPLAASARFTVFPAGGTPVVETADAINGRACSSNLLNASGTGLALVKVECPENSGAVLRYNGPGAKALLSLPAEAQASGIVFHVPVGDVGPNSAILVANVGVAPTQARLLNLTQTIAPREVKGFPLNDHNSNRGLVLGSLDTTQLVAQLVIDGNVSILTPV